MHKRQKLFQNWLFHCEEHLFLYYNIYFQTFIYYNKRTASKIGKIKFSKILVKSACRRGLTFLSCLSVLFRLRKILKLKSHLMCLQTIYWLLQCDVIVKRTIAHYIHRHSAVFCAMIDLSQAYVWININTLCTKLRRAELPEQITNITEYICRNTFVNIVYGGKPSDFFPVGNGTKQGSITSRSPLKIYIIEVLETKMNIPVGCSINCSKINIWCYIDDIVLPALTAQAVQVLLDSLSDTLCTLSLKISVQKSCDIVFPHQNRKMVSDVKIYYQILKTVAEC